MNATVTTGWARAMRRAVGVALACTLMFAGCAKGAKEAASRSDAIRAGGAGTGGPSTCGNGLREGSEECDGADVGLTSCESLGFGSGMLLCTMSCTFDRSMCGSMPAPMAGAGG